MVPRPPTHRSILLRIATMQAVRCSQALPAMGKMIRPAGGRGSSLSSTHRSANPALRYPISKQLVHHTRCVRGP
jgi:hypothetical protein